jgi:hypothetical protein
MTMSPVGSLNERTMSAGSVPIGKHAVERGNTASSREGSTELKPIQAIRVRGRCASTLTGGKSQKSGQENRKDFQKSFAPAVIAVASHDGALGCEV